MGFHPGCMLQPRGELLKMSRLYPIPIKFESLAGGTWASIVKKKFPVDSNGQSTWKIRDLLL